MAGRYVPPLIAGFVGVASGVWIFEPLLRESLHPQQPPILVPSDEEASKLKTYGLPSYSNEPPKTESSAVAAQPLEGIPPVQPAPQKKR